MENQAASTAVLQAALESAKELGDQHAIDALSVRVDAVAGRLAAAVMATARNGTHAQYARMRAEAELVKPGLQQCLMVCPAAHAEVVAVIVDHSLLTYTLRHDPLE